jgi:5-methylcytosine-specific restriction endonuclease McrA
MPTPQTLRKSLAKNPALKAQVFAKTDGRCWYCGEAFGGWLRLPVIDHIVDLAAGGTNHIDNLVPCCDQCNKVKGNRGPNYLRYRFYLEGITAAYESGADFTGLHPFYGEDGQR